MSSPNAWPPLMGAGSSWARAARRLDPVAVWSGRLACFMLIPLVLGLIWEVVARYAFNAPTQSAYDMTFMLHGTFFILRTAFTLQRKGHARTDMHYDHWPPRRQATIDVICYLLFFLPMVWVLIVTGWGYFWKSFVSNQIFVGSAWQPIAWLFKMAMSLTGVLLAIQGLSEVFKCVHSLKHGHWPDDRDPEFQT